jgi:small subunit ribosomal protein S6
MGSAHGARSLRSEAVMGARPDPFRSPNKGTHMALYEHLLIARQDISAQQVDALATHLKTIVEGEGGKVEKQEYWGLRGLAYRIKKNRKGHYVLLNINAPSKAVVELERQLKINEDVLRYITVSVDQFEVSSNKNRRDDRPEGERKPEGAEEEIAK